MLFRQQYLQHIRSMYAPDYKLGLQQTLEAEKARNETLKSRLCAMKTDINVLTTDGEGD